jgi:hypothetical protein
MPRLKGTKINTHKRADILRTPQGYPCQIEIKPNGWWVLTYPFNSRALLLFTNFAEKQQLLIPCHCTSPHQITHTNIYWYWRSACFKDDF